MKDIKQVANALFALIKKECEENGSCIKPIRWYAREVDCTRLEVKDALDYLSKEKAIRKTQHFDESGTRRVKVTIRRTDWN